MTARALTHDHTHDDEATEPIVARRLGGAVAVFLESGASLVLDQGDEQATREAADDAIFAVAQHAHETGRR